MEIAAIKQQLTPVRLKTTIALIKIGYLRFIQAHRW